VTLRLRGPYGDELNEGLTIDVSHGGAQVVLPQLTDGRFNIGDQLSFELVVSNTDVIRGQVRVVRLSGGGHALGLQFCEPRQEQAFLKLVNRAESEDLRRPPDTSDEFPILTIETD
jgi:hypothetical protein